MTKRALLLWTPIVVCPVVWFVAMTANFALAPLPCNGSAPFARGAVWIVALVITAAVGVLAFRLRRRSTSPPAEGAPAERVREMALAGVVLSGAFLLVLIAQSIPDLMLAGCR